MGAREPRVDAYIEQAAPFARPILRRLRKLVHAACPDAEEAMKWSFPHFLYRGKILCSMAAFKQHCTFGFWDGAAVVGQPAETEAMGNFGRLTALGDLPADAALTACIKQGMALRDAGVKPQREQKPKKPAIPAPDDFAKALRGSKQAKATFDNLSPSHRREYLEWITEAKREATRAKRIAQAIEMLAAGKNRNWKYEKC